MAETLAQIVFAIAVGFAFTMTCYKGGSLLPCILARSLIDVFSLFAADDASLLLNWITYAVTLVLSVAYGLYLVKQAAPRFDPPGERPAGPSAP